MSCSHYFLSLNHPRFRIRLTHSSPRVWPCSAQSSISSNFPSCTASIIDWPRNLRMWNFTTSVSEFCSYPTVKKNMDLVFLQRKWVFHKHILQRNTFSFVSDSMISIVGRRFFDNLEHWNGVFVQLKETQPRFPEVATIIRQTSNMWFEGF